MKTVYALSGPSGSGKSTFIRNNNLEGNTLSLDTFREMFSGLEANAIGKPNLSESNNEMIIAYFKKALEQRLFQGGSIFLDNLNYRYSDVKEQIKLANKHGYAFKMIDFTDVSLEQCQLNNKKRQPHKQLSQKQIENIYNKVLETRESFAEKEVEFITPEQAESEFNVEIKDSIVDLNNYKKIHHIGDLQGCYEPLKEYFNQNGGLKDDEFYIFVGDYIDRGIENDKVVNWLLEEGIHKENVVLLKGNHERHLIHYANDITTPARVFVYQTLPELKRNGIDKEELQQIVPHLKNWFAYEYDDKKVFVNHAGAGNLVERPELMNNASFLFGYGGYGYDVDTTFTKNNKETPWYQVHGHRNYREGTVDFQLKSFSLESDVEFNGYLSCLTLNEQGFELRQIPSNIYNPKELRKMEKGMFETRNSSDLEHFVSTKINKDSSPLEMLEKLRENELIRENQFDHISSFNFTRKAFYKKSFDEELVSTARGLFVNNETGEIVARGYDKFFNINERGVESSKMENVEAHTKPPYTLYEKENGFLGIVGYDSTSDELFVASKSTPNSPFAQWLNEILHEQLGEDKLDELKKKLKKHNANAVFEVNDPVNDPHIVEYDERHVVLLDVLKRDYEFQKMEYSHLKEFGKELGLPVKNRGPHFPSFDKFHKFYDAMMNEDPFDTNKKLEGYVIEDANGNMNKMKLPFYNFWKEMRGLRDKIVSCETKEKPYEIKDLIKNRPLLHGSEDKAEDFMKWALDNYDIEDLKEQNVIKMRKEYFDDQQPKEENKMKSSARSKHRP